MKKYYFIFVLLLVVVGCGNAKVDTNPNFLELSVTSSVSAQRKQEEVLHITKLSPGTFSATADYDINPKTVLEWRRGGEEIVINGGYFDENYKPVGYLTVDSKRIGKGMFDQDKSGLFASQNGKITVRNLKTDPLVNSEQFDFAVQSYPFLIEDSKPAIKTISEKRARRTAVGIDKEENLYIISVASKELSLYEFMQELQKTEIPFVHVLNLDGGPSTGIYKKWHSEEFSVDSYFPVPNIIRFIRK